MKKLLGLLLITTALSGCSLAYNTLDNIQSSLYYGHKLPPRELVAQATVTKGETDEYGVFHVYSCVETLKDLKTLQDVATYVHGLLTYKADFIEEVVDPEVSVERGYGDCDDFTLVFMSVAYYALGSECTLITTDRVRTVEDGGVPYHVTFCLNNQAYDVYTGLPADIPIMYEFAFTKVFSP